MADLASVVLRGTDQMSEAYQGLARVRAANRQRKDAAVRAAQASLGEAAQAYRQYGSWKDAKAAENDTKAALEAARLGRVQGGDAGELTALDAYKPSTVAGYKVATERRDAALKRAQDLAEQKYREVQMAHIKAQDKEAADKAAKDAKETANELDAAKRMAAILAQPHMASVAAPDQTDYQNDPRFGTSMPMDREKDWQRWAARNVPQGDTGQDYDYTGAFLAGQERGGPDGHLPDTFKRPNHETFSVESKYAPLAPDKAGYWGPDGEYVAPPEKATLRALSESQRLRQQEVQMLQTQIAAGVDIKSAMSRLVQIAGQARQEENDLRDEAAKKATEFGKGQRAAMTYQIQKQNADTARARGEAYASHLNAQEENDAAAVRFRAEANQIARDEMATRLAISTNHDNVALARLTADQAIAQYEIDLKALAADKKLLANPLWRKGEDKTEAYAGLQAKEDALTAAHNRLMATLAALPKPGPMQTPQTMNRLPDLTPDEKAAYDSLDDAGKKTFLEALGR